MRVEGRGDSKTFAIRTQSEGESKELKFRTYINERGILKVESLGDIPKTNKPR